MRGKVVQDAGLVHNHFYFPVVYEFHILVVKNKGFHLYSSRCGEGLFQAIEPMVQSLDIDAPVHGQQFR